MSIEIIDNTSPAELTADVLYVLRCCRCTEELVDASRARDVAGAAIELGWRKVRFKGAERLYCNSCVDYIRTRQAIAQAGA